MKHKLIALLLAALFALGVFTGCAPKEETPAVPEQTPDAAPAPCLSGLQNGA